MKRIIKLSVLLLSLAFVFNSCDKDSSSNDPEGKIIFKNVSANPYAIYINGSYAHTQNGNTEKVVQKIDGTYTIRVLQQSGYVLYPTDLTKSVSLSKGEKVTITFPF